MPKSLALFATMVLLAGCATANRQPIEAKAGAALQGQSLASTKRPAASFSAMTPSKAALGVFGVAAMYSEGAGIVNNNQIDDPAGAVGAALAKALAAQRGARLADAALAVDGDDAAQIAGAAQGKARYLIDVSTANWALQYFPTDWTHFQVTYSAKARLIDVDSKAVLAEGHCAAPQADSKNAPTYDEMLAGEAALLKRLLAGAAAHCANTLKAEMLSLRVEPDSAPLRPAPVGKPAGPAATAVAAAGPVERWAGTMACAARQDDGPYAAAYQAKFAIEVAGPRVVASRSTEQVSETLSGQVRDALLELRGRGHWNKEPARSWQFAIKGAFPPGATSYVGNGSMLANGQPIRACQLRMSRGEPAAL